MFGRAATKQILGYLNTLESKWRFSKYRTYQAGVADECIPSIGAVFSAIKFDLEEMLTTEYTYERFQFVNQTNYSLSS